MSERSWVFFGVMQGFRFDQFRNSICHAQIILPKLGLCGICYYYLGRGVWVFFFFFLNKNNFNLLLFFHQALQMDYFSNKPAPTPGHKLPQPGANKEPLKPGLKRKRPQTEPGNQVGENTAIPISC